MQETNECDPDPCLNNGICVDEVQAYTCNRTSFAEDNVLTYYTGRNCGTGEKEEVMCSFDIVASFFIINSLINSPLHSERG